MVRFLVVGVASLLLSCGSSKMGVHGTVSLTGAPTSEGVAVSLLFGSSQVASTTTDAAGNYDFEISTPGLYVVSATAPSTKEGSVSSEVVAQRGENLPAPLLTLQGLGTLNVTFAQPTGELRTWTFAIGDTSVTRSAGEALSLKLPVGSYQANTTIDGASVEQDNVSIAYASTNSLTVTIPIGRRGSAKGQIQVSGATDAQLGGLPVKAHASLTEFVATATTTDGGWYEFPSLGVDRYSITAAPAQVLTDGRFGTAPFVAADVVAGQQSDVGPLSYVGLGSITGKVTKGGTPQAAVQVCSKEQLFLSHSAFTSDAGVYSVVAFAGDSCVSICGSGGTCMSVVVPWAGAATAPDLTE